MTRRDPSETVTVTTQGSSQRLGPMTCGTATMTWSSLERYAMRRTAIAIVSSVLLTSALVLGGPMQAASAQSAHDIIGSWLVELTGTDAPSDQAPYAGASRRSSPMARSSPVICRSGRVDRGCVPRPVAECGEWIARALLYTTAGQGIWTATARSGRP